MYETKYLNKSAVRRSRDSYLTLNDKSESILKPSCLHSNVNVSKLMINVNILLGMVLSEALCCQSQPC